MRIAIIGGGNMGTALCKALINKNNISTAEEISVCDNNPERLQALRKLNIKTCSDPENIVDSEIIVLAIKPQDFSSLSKKLENKINPNSLLISIMAGVTIRSIQEKTKHRKVIRSMPNTPALVNRGVIGWIADESISESEKETVQKLFSSAGYAFEVDKESQIDDTTALSGCGPGFFFYIFDQWLQASAFLDLPKEKKKQILLKTLQGSLQLLSESEESALELSQRVASKGGSTEQGLKVLSEAKLEKTFEAMLSAAHNRCQEMSQEHD